LLADPEDRADKEKPGPTPKQLIASQLQRLTVSTAVQVGGFAMMDNHLHLLVRIDAEAATAWSAVDVARRWFALHPPRRVAGADDAWLTTHASRPDWVTAHRKKLCSFSQFVKDLKQPIAERLNRRWGERGAFWQGRCKISRAEGNASVLAMLAYIDLNPHAAGLVEIPEHGRDTSLEARLAAWRETAGGITPDGEAGRPQPTDHHPRARNRWLLSLGNAGDDRAPHNLRRSLLPGMTLARYLKYLDAAARRIREGKVSLNASARSVFERLSEEAWKVYPPGKAMAGVG